MATRTITLPVQAISRRKVYAFGVDAGNDANGNPRRGWFIYAPDGTWLGFLDEEYWGTSILRRAFPGAVELANRVPTTPGTYRDLKREAPEFWR